MIRNTGRARGEQSVTISQHPKEAEAVPKETHTCPVGCGALELRRRSVAPAARASRAWRALRCLRAGALRDPRTRCR